MPNLMTEKMENKKKEKKNLKMLKARRCRRGWWRMVFKHAFDNYVYNMILGS